MSCAGYCKQCDKLIGPDFDAEYIGQHCMDCLDEMDEIEFGACITRALNEYERKCLEDFEVHRLYHFNPKRRL